MSHFTAIKRTAPSVPMRWLDSESLLVGRVLDFGCGRGFDAKHYGIESYDPHWQPNLARGPFNTVTCIYVLNTIEPAEIATTLDKVVGLLSLIFTLNGHWAALIRTNCWSKWTGRLAVS